MSYKPRLLDAYCCAGGAGMGYHLAGFEVVGVDIAPQRNFPFEFHQGDAIEFIREHAHEFDAVHASPPCQRHSRMSNCRPGLADTYPDLIGPTRAALDATGLPYVIENVEGSSVRPDITLCGYTFGRQLYRHRLFEANFPLWAPEHKAHDVPASKAGHWRPGTIMSVSGHIAPMSHAREIMEINWTNRHELAESIPPFYAEFVGSQLMAHLTAQGRMIIHLPLSPIGATVGHSQNTTCWLCQTTCAECGHSVEDGVHAAGCDECACPLHLHPEEAL